MERVIGKEEQIRRVPVLKIKKIERGNIDIETSENDESNASKSEDEKATQSDSMSTDGEENKSNPCFAKAPDQVQQIIREWGKGTTCEVRFSRNKEMYHSVGEVVKRSSRKGMVKIQISYKEGKGEGPQGILHLPPSDRIKIWSLSAVKLNKIKAIGNFLDEKNEDQDEEEVSVEEVSVPC